MGVKNNKRWIYISIPIFFLWFFGQIEKLGISVIQTDPEFLSDLGIANDNAKIGMLTFAFFVTYAVSNFFWGFFIDKYGTRLTAIVGVLIWSVTLILGGLSTTYFMFLMTRILLGIGEGMMIPVCGKFISNWFNRNEVGRAQSSWVSGNYTGPAVGAVFISAVIYFFGWQATFYILAALNIVVVLPMLMIMTRDNPADHPKIGKEELAYINEVDLSDTKGEPKKSFAQDFRYWITWFGMMMSSFLFFGLSIWLPTFLIQEKGFNAELMTAFTSMSWLFALTFVILCGFLADKTRRPSLLATILFISCAFLLIISISSSVAIISALAIGLAMGTMGGVFHLSNLFIVKYSTKETAGRAAGLMGFTNIFGGFASYAMGWIRDLSNGSFTPSLMVLVLFATFGFIAYLFTLKKENEEVGVINYQDKLSKSI